MKILYFLPELPDSQITRLAINHSHVSKKIESKNIPDLDLNKYESLYGKDERCPHRNLPCGLNRACNCDACKNCPKG